MRVVKEIKRADYKITIYAWNNRYIIKFEKGLLEQTYKISEIDLTSEQDLEELLSPVFLQRVEIVFEQMYSNLSEAVSGL